MDRPDVNEDGGTDDEESGAVTPRRQPAPGLDAASVDASPIRQFDAWFREALAAQPREPTAVMLATVSPDGRPAARMVLLKGFDDRGFIFFSNYQSRKGEHLAQNPWAALCFYWSELTRQVRVEGYVEQISAEESDEYFRTRPRGSQIGAWASEQSRVIEGREALEQRVKDLTEYYEGHDVPRPPHWGGYRLSPVSIELWQGRPDRLHDRLRYTLTASGDWSIERLSP